MTQFMLTKHAGCFSYNYYNNVIPEHLRDDPVLCERTVPLPSCTELITADRSECPVFGC